MNHYMNRTYCGYAHMVAFNGGC